MGYDTVKQTFKDLGSQILGSVGPIFVIAYLVFIYRTTDHYGVESNVGPGVIPIFIGLFSLVVGLLGTIVETILPQRDYSLMQWFFVGASYSSILAVLLHPYLGALLFFVFNPVVTRLFYLRVSNNKNM